MFLNDPTESLQTTASLLEETLYERFDRLGNARASYKFRIAALSIPGPDSRPIQITMLQLVTYLRDLPLSPAPTKPNLWELGGNVISIRFEQSIT